MQNRKASQSVLARAGFSLVEILIVIGIIGLLVAVLVIAIGPSLESARINATRTTIEQLEAMVQQRVEAFNQTDLSNQAKLVRIQYNNASNTSPLPASIQDRVAEVLVKKNRYLSAFPQREADLYGFDGTDATADDAPLRSSWPSPATPPHTAKSESSELLYLFLTTGTSFGAPKPDLDSINPKHIDDTDGDGLMEFIDEWGEPLQFYNAPTRLFKPSGGSVSIIGEVRALFASIPGENDTTASSPMNIDPYDPLNLINGWDNNSFDLRISGSDVTCVGMDAANYWDADTYFTFLIVSAGPDQALGINLPTASGASRLGAVTSDLESITDNITNRQQ